MAKDLPLSMRKVRKARCYGKGEAWFYISPKGIEICMSASRGAVGVDCATVTKKQLQTALDEIEKYSQEATSER